MNQAVIVALPIGNDVYTYKDGDETPVHQTLVFLGETLNITTEEIGSIASYVNDISMGTAPFVATVSGSGYLGPDREQIVLTEAKELQGLRDIFLLDPVINEVMSRVDQYPTWVSHVSTLKNYKFGDQILFNRLGLWYGEDRRVYDFKRPALFPSD